MSTVFADANVVLKPHATDVVLYMRKLLTIFVAILLMPGSGIAELQNGGRVIEHYLHHVQEHGETDLSFFEFLVDHFGTSSHHDSDHRQLPFHDCQTSHAPVVYVAATGHVDSEPPSSSTYNVEQRREGQPLHHSGFVFQPPRS